MKKHSAPTSKFSKLTLFLILFGLAPFVTKADVHTVTFHVHSTNGEQSTEQGSITARLNDWVGELISSGDKVENNATVRFEANPAKGYRVSSWYRNGSVITNIIISDIYILENITEDVEITVEFEEFTHSVTFNVINGIGGRLIAEVDGVEIQSGARVGNNKNVRLTAIADPGFHVKTWHDGALWRFSTDTVFQIWNLFSNRTIRVEFEGLPHEITVEGGALGDNKTTDTITAGTVVTIIADEPEEGMRLANWDFSTAVTFMENTDETFSTAKFIMPSEDVFVKAVFELVPIPIPSHTVTFNSLGGSDIAGQTVEYGETAEKPANPTRTGFVFEDWYTDTNYTVMWNFATCIVTSDTTLFAKWTFDETTNIVETHEPASLQAFPNPFINEIHIADAVDFSLQVLTQTGAIAHMQQVTNPHEIVNLQRLPAGVYILRLEKNGEIRTARIIKQ